MSETSVPGSYAAGDVLHHEGKPPIASTNAAEAIILIDYTDTWEKTTMLCAQIVGKETLAEQAIKETQEIIANTKVQLSSLENKTFALLRVDGKANFNAQGSKNTMYYNQTAGFGRGIRKRAGRFL